jgi:hypothetical protein
VEKKLQRLVADAYHWCKDALEVTTKKNEIENDKTQVQGSAQPQLH